MLMWNMEPWMSNISLLDMFAKLQKVNLTLSCLFVSMEQLSSHWMGFHEILYFNTLWKCFWKIQV